MRTPHWEIHSRSHDESTVMVSLHVTVYGLYTIIHREARR